MNPPLLWWLLQMPPRSPWPPESWTIKASYPRTIEKEYSSGIENTRSPAPMPILLSGTWEKQHLNYADQPQMNEESNMFRNGITKTKNRPKTVHQATWDKKSWASIIHGPEEDVFKSLWNPLKFLLFFYWFFCTLSVLPSSSLYSQKGCYSWTHHSPLLLNRWGLV